MTYEDVAFEGMPEPPAPAVRKRAETKVGASWTRYKAARPYHCDVCLAYVHERWPNGTHAPNDAVYRRVLDGETSYLCALHGTELKAADEALRPQRGKGK